MSMWRDFVYAYRILRKSPIATAVTILALALGIGANTGSFVAIDAILLHPFPYPQLDRIVTLWGTQPKTGLNRAGVTAGDFADWKRQNQSFETLAAYQPWNVNLTGKDRPEPVNGARVGEGFFETFGMRPRLGNSFTADTSDSNNRVAVLSERLWRTKFAAAQDIIGKPVALAGQNYTVIGVMPDDFDFPLAAQVWVPLVLTPAEQSDRTYHNLAVVGRTKPGVNVSQASAEI